MIEVAETPMQIRYVEGLSFTDVSINGRDMAPPDETDPASFEVELRH